MPRSHRVGTTLAGMSLLVLAACAGSKAAQAPDRGHDFCAAVYARDFACASPEGQATLTRERDATLRACRAADRDVEDEKELLYCTVAPTCADYQQCLGGIRAALAEEPVDEDDLLHECKYGEIRDASAKATCREVLKRAIDAKAAELRAIRDAGDDGVRPCLELKDLADRVSAEEASHAHVLCREVDASVMARRAIDEAKRNLDADERKVPFQCSMAVEDLEALKSEWAQARLREVLDACYVALGRKILPVLVKKMVICEYQVEQIYQAVKKFDLRDAELDPWIAKATAKCAEPTK